MAGISTFWRDSFSYKLSMPRKSAPKKTKLTDVERHKRFKEMAREVGASEDPKAFGRAFKTVTQKKGH